MNRNEKITIALSLLLALSAMAGCSVHRNYYGWERRRQEQKCCSHATVTLFKRISDECMIAKAWPCVTALMFSVLRPLSARLCSGD